MKSFILFVALSMLAPKLLANDDTGKLRTIIQTAEAGNKVAHIGPGTFSIQPQTDGGPMLPIKSNVTVRCVPGTVLKIADGKLVGGLPGIVFAAYKKNSRGVWASSSPTDVTIEGCTIDGNARGNPLTYNQLDPKIADQQVPFTAPIMQFVIASGVTVKKIHFIDLAFGGIWFYNTERSNILENSFYRTSQVPPTTGKPWLLGDAIQLNGVNDVVVAHNHLANIGEGIFLQHSTSSPKQPSRNTLITNNIIQNLDANKVCQSKGVPFSCCANFENGSGTGLCAKGKSGGSSIGILARNAIVSDNILRDASQISVQSGRGFSTDGVMVTGNSSTGSNANCITVISNTETRNIRVADNQCNDYAGSGVNVSSEPSGPFTTTVEIEDNTLGPCSPGVSCGAPVVISDPSREAAKVRVISNHLVTNTEEDVAITVEGARDVTVMENTLELDIGVPVIRIQDPVKLLWKDNWGVPIKSLEELSNANLSNGSRTYCTDCTQEERCNDGGEGAFATFVRGEWQCN